MPACRTRASRGVPVPSPAWSLLARVWGPEVVVRVGAGAVGAAVARDAKDAPHSGVAAGDILRVRGHFCAAGDVLRARGRECCPRRRRMPPGWKDTHPAAWNVPVVGGGASATDPGTAVRTDGMPEDRRGASRRAGPAAPPGLTAIVATRPHRKDVTGVPGQESLEHQSSERRGHPSRGAMDRQALSRRCWRSHRRDWGYPAAAAAGCCCYCCCYCCHCLYRRRP